MNGSTQVHPAHRFLPETLASGSLTEGVGALGTIILAILGLAGVFTNIVAAVAIIVVGAVFLADSLLARSAAHTLHSQGIAARGSGMTAGFFAGIAGIILGILSFFQMMPERLLSVAILVLGAAMFVSGGTLARLNALLTQPQSTMAPSAIGIGSGSVFIGLAVTVMGILAVIGLVPMTLILVGLLCLGAGALFTGGETMAETA